MAKQIEAAKTRLCRVLSVTDEQAGGRIQVRFIPEDEDITDDKDLPYCFPLIPKMMHCLPKVNETVVVILPGAPKSNRFYIGPIISQDYRMNFDPFDFQSRMFLGTGNIGGVLPNPDNDPENEGTCPDIEDIALRGRKDADLILKDREIRLRCGFKKYPTGPAQTSLHFNREDLGYILMRYKKSKDHKGKDYSSSINLVADRINLLSHDSPEVFALSDRKDLITDDEMKTILEKAHPLVYGDDLVAFLQDLVDIIRNHSHSFAGLPPSFSAQDEVVLQADLNQILSKSVRTN